MKITCVFCPANEHTPVGYIQFQGLPGGSVNIEWGPPSEFYPAMVTALVARGIHACLTPSLMDDVRQAVTRHELRKGEIVNVQKDVNAPELIVVGSKNV